MEMLSSWRFCSEISVIVLEKAEDPNTILNTIQNRLFSGMNAIGNPSILK